MNENKQILNKDNKITRIDLNEASKWSRYCIYVFIILILGTYLIFKPSNDIMGNLVLSLSGLVLMVFSYLWGIKLKYIPGNWKGSDMLRLSSGIRGIPAKIIGYSLLFIGLGMFILGIFKNVS